jgi:ligand-binding sensor domain-containing protein
MKQCLINCFFPIVSLLPLSIKAQSTGIICKHYGIQNGLPANGIEFVYVDKEGYAWFASANGLQQFDGYNFTNYIYDADDTSSISYNFISWISEDKAGNIWIGTLGKGVNILN